MQTRGVLGFRFAGIDKITYVNDGAAPGQLGEQLCAWFKVMLSWKNFKKEVYRMRRLDDMHSTDNYKLDTCISLNIDVPANPSWYNILRVTQGNPDLIVKARYYLNYKPFFLTSRLCAYGYIVNLDTEKFEVYKNIGLTKHDLGRYSLKKHPSPAMIGRFDLNSVPSNWRAALLQIK